MSLIPFRFYQKMALICGIVLTLLLLGTSPLQAQDTPSSQSGFEQLKKKAESGDAIAEYSVGMAYLNGTGVSSNNFTALRWFQKAAEHGHAEAQIRTGMAYIGLGPFTQNRTNSLHWFLKAANQNNPTAQCLVADLYLLGTYAGVPASAQTNRNEVEYWYRKAADQDNPYAQFQLSFLSHYRKNATDAEKVQSMEYCLKSARQNFQPAFREMGWRYGFEKGQTNLVEAWAWYDLYCSRAPQETGMFGHATTERSILEKSLTPEQLTAARKRSDQLKSEIPNKTHTFYGLMYLLRD